MPRWSADARVGVPGVPRLLELAHRAHGRLPWATLFAPAIALAENGFAVSPRLHRLIASERYFVQPRVRAYFLDANGAPLEVGQRLRNPAYAATLRILAAQGASAFYRGAIADDIVDTVRDYAPNPGDMTLADLADYRAIAREPVCGRYRRLRICGMPPPSSGGIGVLQTLSMLERFDLAAMGAGSLWSVHFIGEAERLAYADRQRYIGDPAFVDVPAGLARSRVSRGARALSAQRSRVRACAARQSAARRPRPAVPSITPMATRPNTRRRRRSSSSTRRATRCR